jgi:LacI family transcriptional regulator
MATSRAPGSAATITDVAALAKVSIKTVSRVMNNEPGVRADTRESVMKVMAELNYRPKLSARSLAGARSFLIGLLYFDPSAAFVAGVQQGATLRCREAGYHLVVESVSNDALDLDEQVDRMVSALRPDGMILTPPLCDNPNVLKALRAAHTPCVLLSPKKDLDDMASVRMDDVHAAEEITSHLIALGHRHIGFIKGAPDQIASTRRHQGYLRALKSHGIPLEKALVQQGAFSYDSGVECAKRLFDGDVRPTAIFASNDDMALGVMAEAGRRRLAVPGDVSIAGFDDSPGSRLVWPALTTVRQPTGEMARVAVEMLIAAQRPDAAAASDGADAASRTPHRVVAHEVIVRESTGKPPKARRGA